MVRNETQLVQQQQQKEASHSHDHSIEAMHESMPEVANKVILYTWGHQGPQHGKCI